jgi:single-strand DNA-binding protein
LLPHITIDGRLTADPELRFTPTGKAVASFRVAANDARRDDATGTWENTEQIFVNVSIWEDDAEEVAENLRRGDRVIVTGKIFQREFTRQDGTKGWSLDMKFPTVSKVIRTSRSTTPARSTAPQTGQQASPPAADPWAAWPPPEEPPF